VQILLIVALLFAILVAIFASQNTMSVPVHFLAWRIEAVSVSVLILVSAACGAMLAVLFGLGRLIKSGVAGRRRQKEISHLQVRLQDLQTALEQRETDLRERDAEIRALRAVPVTAPNPSLAPALPGESEASSTQTGSPVPRVFGRGPWSEDPPSSAERR
jgi:lipopolysaccharide assembly protein A